VPNDTADLIVFFAHSGSAGIKVALGSLMKLTPDLVVNAEYSRFNSSHGPRMWVLIPASPKNKMDHLMAENMMKTIKTKTMVQDTPKKHSKKTNA